MVSFKVTLRGLRHTDCIIQKHYVLKNLCMSNLMTKSLEMKLQSRLILQVPEEQRSHFRPEESALGLLSMIEPTKVDEALSDDGWILAM